MIGSAIRLALLMSCTLTLCRGQGGDATRVEGGSGRKIVDAVVTRIRSRCVFPEDRLFLRRLAKVKSNDGTATYTYRPNFHGGIWQLTEAMFNATKDCTNGLIEDACDAISSEVGVQWTSVRYSELRKPLYSGLAAALSSLLALNGQSMPGNVTDQAEVAKDMFGDGDDVFKKNADLPPVECNDKLDLAFILDSSGSVSYSDFNLMLDFTADVVDHLNVSSDSVRVADIVYSTRTKLHFDFNDYTDKADAIRRLKATPKENSGTNTAAGLNLATQTMYDTSRGARGDAKKVAILITDGQSSSYTATVASASQLKSNGTTVFAVGVGNYYKNELDAVASVPICSHVLTLTSFDHIQSLLTEILKVTCEANYKLLNEMTNITRDIPEGGSETTAETNVPSANETIEASVSCGILNIFVSSTDPKPSEAVYDTRYVSVPGAPAYLTFPKTLASGATVYVTVVGTRLPPTAAQARQCSDFSWTLAKTPKKNTTVTCAEDGVPRPCTKRDVITAGLCQNDVSDFPFENPCTQANLDKGLMRHPYPYDGTKFLQCNMKGDAYITQCPRGVSYNPDSSDCGFTSPPLSDGSTQENNVNRRPQNSSGVVTLAPHPSSQANPCTREALSKQQFYHEYAQDSSKFLQCDEWGRFWIMPCAPSTVWSQSSYTCVKKAKQTAPSSTSSCTFTCTATSPTYNAHPCNRFVYYVCVNSRRIERTCPAGTYFNSNSSVCDHA